MLFNWVGEYLPILPPLISGGGVVLSTWLLSGSLQWLLTGGHWHGIEKATHVVSAPIGSSMYFFPKLWSFALSKPLIGQRSHSSLLRGPFIFLFRHLLLLHQVDDQVCCLKPYAQDFFSSLSFRATPNEVPVQQQSVFIWHQDFEPICEPGPGCFLFHQLVIGHSLEGWV